MTRVDLARLSDVASGVPSGTSFPVSPTDGDLFFRTDLDLLCRYRSTGTRWVTVTLYAEPFGVGDKVNPDIVGSGMGRMSVWSTDYDLYLESFYATTFVATTNSGSHFWNVAVNKTTAANVSTSIATFSTAADTVNNYTNHKVSIAAILGGGATYKTMTLNPAVSGSPGNLYVTGKITYRLIVT